MQTSGVTNNIALPTYLFSFLVVYLLRCLLIGDGGDFIYGIATAPHIKTDKSYYFFSSKICIINKSLLYLQCDNEVTEMFELVEGLNDREEMLDNLRFLIRYEEKILEDEMIFTKSEFYEELFSTIVMLADDLQKD